MKIREVPVPTAKQVEVTVAVTRWYLERYHDTHEDLGVARMFTDERMVGAFAVPSDALASGEPGALFRVLVATVMFQRRQDQQILRVLRGIGPEDVAELTCPDTLLAVADNCGCSHACSLGELLRNCDLRKDEGGNGACGRAPAVACAPKRHAVLLKRYGHFGKVPTGLALVLREHGVRDLDSLRRWSMAGARDGGEASARLEGALCTAWRVSHKISAMYLSMLANPDLCPGLAPWSAGLDDRRWVVVDSNVDIFLGSIGYTGSGTYEARAAFVRALGRLIDLSTIKPGLRADNPRIVQQAMYMFMSVANRRVSERDCSRQPTNCALCERALRERCGLRAKPC